MPTRLYSVVFDTPDPARLGRWWAETLRWPAVFEAEDEVALAVSDDEEVVPSIVFVQVPDPKTVKNRVHLDLATQTEAELDELVERLLRRGATRVDVGQGDVPWAVLADPEGNEFCVLEPRAEYAGRGSLAAIVMDAEDPAALAPYWAAASGWPVAAEFAEGVTFRNRAGALPDLDILAVPEPKTAKNRVHLDVAPYAADDLDEEVVRLVDLGARRVDVGQGADATWVVLADPEGNEACVLRAR